MTENVFGSAGRVSALKATNLLDRERDVDFDQLVRLACKLLRVPNALITLVSSDRQYVLSAADDGPQANNPQGSSKALDDSFCKFVVATAEPFLVEDAREHPLVRESAAVASGVVAYAGVPLLSDGEAIGAICVIDSRPRSWSSEELSTLRALARSAMQLVMEKRPHPRRLTTDGALTEAPTRLMDCLSAHLRGIAAYKRLISTECLNLDDETKAQEVFVASFHQLIRAVEASATDVDPELQSLTSTYLEAEQKRLGATRRFARGETNLSSLQALIEAQNDSLAALRLAALDRGAEL